MIIKLEYQGVEYSCDLSKPLDISIPVGRVRCFYATEYLAKPYESGFFIGSVNEGAPVNFYDLQLNPHGNGTHTECLGHITKVQESVNDELKEYHFVAQLISVKLSELSNGDHIVQLEELKDKIQGDLPKALIVRTLPNSEEKLTKDYSGTNPPYLDVEVMKFLVESGVEHLLLDLPSVDREVDEGKLLAHHVFWNVEGTKKKDESRQHCTITELIYVPDSVTDGLYMLNMQIPSIELDAVPSKPVLYALVVS